jgi:hypothetical protein
MGPINSPKTGPPFGDKWGHLVWGNGDVARHAAPRPTRVAQNPKLLASNRKTAATSDASGHAAIPEQDLPQWLAINKLFSRLRGLQC